MMRRRGWAAYCGVRRLLAYQARLRRQFARLTSPDAALNIRRAMGVTDGSSLDVELFAREFDEMESIRLDLRVLALLHVHRSVMKDRLGVRVARLLHLRLSRCMALFTRHLAMWGPAAICRSAPGV
ncbi:hypothetical protein ACFXDE_21245 [Kitasatospora sp. NPDC059408]|uniref:hypothetical protein n=1 Tax=Kitasatospora sp. NPDC059408 TaxID=3346823 RepID=UPI0036BE85AA